MPPEPATGYNNNGVPSREHARETYFSDDGCGSALGDDEPLVYEDIDDLEREFEAWKMEEEERRAIKEAEMEKIRKKAVMFWKDKQLREVEIRRQKLEEERSSLRAELTKQRIAPQQIENIFFQKQVNSDSHLLSLNPASDKASIVKSGDGIALAKSSRRWSIWSRKYVLERSP